MLLRRQQNPLFWCLCCSQTGITVYTQVKHSHPLYSGTCHYHKPATMRAHELRQYTQTVYQPPQRKTLMTTSTRTSSTLLS